ncbi:hypothetical protein PHLH8_35760 [Pseudomonas sp. Pc102]|nr:hypothetical protein PHLH8_35760 [Pseudomonas sp. Pc102]
MGCAGASCFGFNEKAQERRFQDDSGFLAHPPHGFRFALHHPTKAASRGVHPVVMRISMCIERRRWSSGQTPLSGGRAQSSFQGLSDMDVARASMGQGWPFEACPWNDDGAREVWLQPDPYGGASPFGFFWVVRHPDDCQKKLARGGETRNISKARQSTQLEAFQQHLTQTEPMSPCLQDEYRPREGGRRQLAAPLSRERGTVRHACRCALRRAARRESMLSASMAAEKAMAA